MIEWRASLGRTKETLSNFTPFLRPRRVGLLLALVLLLLETAMSLAQPWPLALTLDYVLNDRRELPGFWPESLSGEARSSSRSFLGLRGKAAYTPTACAVSEILLRNSRSSTAASTLRATGPPAIWVVWLIHSKRPGCGILSG